MNTFIRTVFPLWVGILLLSTPAQAYQRVEFFQEFGSSQKDPEKKLFDKPRAVAVFGDNYYIADTEAHRVVVLSREGSIVRAWGGKGNNAGQFKLPAGIAVDEEGHIYVSDTGNGRIQVFNHDGSPIRIIGGKGSGPKEFSKPSGLAASKGLLYVADPGNKRVQVLTVGGIYLKQLTWKTETDEMKSPVAVAVGDQNTIYVLDAGTKKIRVFDQAGAQFKVIDLKGRDEEAFGDAVGIALDENGFLYVTDSDQYKFRILDPQGKLLGSIGSGGDGPGQFRKATGVAVDQNGRVAVLDAVKNTLQLFVCDAGLGKPVGPWPRPSSVELLNVLKGVEVSALMVHKQLWHLTGAALLPAGGNDARTIGSAGAAPGSLKKARGVAVDASGNFWVADTGNDRLQQFSPEGAFLQVVGKSGSADGAFDSPSGIAVSPKGNIFVADSGNRRVQVFSARGVFLASIGKAGKETMLREPVDVAVDQNENVYVVDRGSDRVMKFDDDGTILWSTGQTGSLEGEFRKPENLALSADGHVYVLDAGNARVQVLSNEGTFLRAFGNEGTEPGEFRSPQGLALEDGIRLHVGDRGNNRVQSFTLIHTPASPEHIALQAGPNEVQVSWNAGTESYLEKYKVYRSEAPDGPFVPAGESDLPSFLDRNLKSNRTFYYRVSSLARQGNESPFSTVVSVQTPKLVPAAPLSVKAEVLPRQVSLSWMPNAEAFMKSYRVYRSTDRSAKFAMVATVEKPLFVDKQLEDSTTYYYRVAAVGREEDEGPPCAEVSVVTPASLPPVEITKLESPGIFSSAYKYYEAHPLGRVTIKNNTDTSYQKLKLSFSIRNFMDFPTEIVIAELAAREEKEFALNPVFNNRILEVTENTPLQTEVAVAFLIDGQPRTVTQSFSLTLYERHAMVWDRKEKLGAFVTLRDPPVADFTRSVVQLFVDVYPALPQPLVNAMAVYDALGLYGLKYMADPTSPFSDCSENSAVIDYLQYPRDTLARKSGDCDDLSTLFAACMENIGISTAFIDVPGHVFVMINTGVPEKELSSLGFDEELMVAHQGTLWIPVEMTLVGSPFAQAWQRGAEEYREWTAKGKADIVITGRAWNEFKPVTLPQVDFKAAAVTKADIETRMKDEIGTLTKQRLAHLAGQYMEALARDPQDQSTLCKLGILYGENQLYAEATAQFQKLLEVDKNSAIAYNNIGNIHFRQDKLEDARAAYETALACDPDDAGIKVNLARVLLRMGKKPDARKIFQETAAADPRVVRIYGDLATNLGVVK